MIKIKIDCTKIQKERLFAGKNGAKYLDAVLIETTNSQYGDTHVIVQEVSKEEREKGIKGPILGNARVIERTGGAQQRRNGPAPAEKPPVDDSEPPF